MDFLLQPEVMLVAFPVLAGVVCLLLVPRCFERLWGVIATLAAAMTVCLAWQVFRAGPFSGSFLPGVALRVDALSGFVALAVTVFGFLISLYSTGFMKGHERLPEYYAYLLWTVGISCGAVLADDLVLLLIFWGLLGFALYAMIGLGGPGASAAAKKTFIVVGGSDCLLMLGVVIIWLHPLAGTTRMSGLSLPLSGELSVVAFLCFASAALAKAGAMPFHSWVPDCGEKAPIPVTAFLPASLDKLLGIYLLARAATQMFQMNMSMNMLLMLVGAGTVICAVMMALVQHDLKRLLSYHAVSQVGYMVLGIGTGTAVGIAGGLFHMLNHAIYKSCLFLCAGSVESRTGDTDLDRLGGLAKVMPVTFASCFVAALAISGIPPLNGFASKWMVYQGVVQSGTRGGHLWIVWLAAAMLGSALTLASFVKVLHSVFLCKPSKELAGKSHREVGLAMWLPTALLAALCLVFGVFAWRLPLRSFIFPAVGELLGRRVWVDGWGAGTATLALVASYVIGVVIYLLTTVRGARECTTYIGGEILDEVHISGEGPGRPRHVDVTGVDFYRTVEELPELRGIYEAAGKKLFDLYEVGTKAIFYFVEALRRAHTGVLSVYLTWVLAGFLALLWVLAGGMG